MSTILVTGGAGYIGSHACKALAAAGHEPVTYDNLSRGHPEAVRWGPLETGDLLDRSRLDAVLRRYRPRAVMHFAAFAYVGESVRDPGLYWRNNVGGSLTLLEAMHAAGMERLVFSSTCAVYGEPPAMPITESMPLAPVNPYGVTKRVVEQMISDCAHAHGLRAIALRYFNAAGADPEGETGEHHEPETHLLPLVLEAIRDPSRPVTVFGRDYPTPDGSCVRDYIHVTDLARAHVLALDALEGGTGFAACNLGTGRGHSVLEVIEAARRVTGKPPAVRDGERRPGDPPRLVADTGSARERLGWRPEYPAVDDMIAHAWAWLNRQA